MTNDHQLLVIFFAKNGHTRLHAVEQFHHHGADTNEKARPEKSFQNIGQLRRGLHLEGLRLGVQLLLVRGKQHITTGRMEPVAVGLPGARVSVKVFVRQKLQAIDKDAGHSHIAQRLGLGDQGQMALMQVAHGGHKSGVFERAEVIAEFGDGVYDFHDGSAYQACWLLSGNEPSLTAVT